MLFPLAVAAAVIAGNLAFDMSINALQNWYDTVYEDSFWSHRVKDSPALRALALEEAEINRLMNDDFPTAPKGD
jgi:hypothetical protein